MRCSLPSYSFFIKLIIFQICLIATIKPAISLQTITNKYEAIVLGEITKSKVRKIGNYYITEYKLKPSKWIYKKKSVDSNKKYLTLKVLGADLPKKGIAIKTSIAPDYIPIKKKAIFLLQKTKSKKDNVFTVSKGGIIIQNS